MRSEYFYVALLFLSACSDSYTHAENPPYNAVGPVGRQAEAVDAVGQDDQVAPPAPPGIPSYGTVSIRVKNIKGIGVGDQRRGTGRFDHLGVGRRDPSDVIRLRGQYYAFYTKMVKYPSGAGGKIAPIWPEGYAFGEIWYATSSDGLNWTERGRALGRRGGTGKWDSMSVFTPNILKGKDGKLYLYYTGIDEDGPSGSKPWINDATMDITQIGVARLEMGRDGRISRATRLNGGKPILSPTFGKTGRNGRPLFDSFRVDDAAMLMYDYNKDGKLEYGLYCKGRSQEGTPGETKMGLAISNAPDRGFVRAKRDGSPVQPKGHEVMIWAQGQGVASLVSSAGRGIWYARDGINFRESSPNFSGRVTAPGAYRPELTRHGYSGGIHWGIAMQQKGNRFLVFWSGKELNWSVAGDVNGDRRVNQADIDAIFANWYETVAAGSTADGDLFLDGHIDQRDIEVVLNHWAHEESPEVEYPEDPDEDVE